MFQKSSSIQIVYHEHTTINHLISHGARIANVHNGLYFVGHFELMHVTFKKPLQTNALASWVKLGHG